MASEQAAAAAAFQVALPTATKAAEATTAALAEIKRSQGSGLANRPKELELTGRPEEDRRLWSDWRFAATQYLMAKDAKFQESLQVVLTSATPVVMSAIDRKSRPEAGSSSASWLARSRGACWPCCERTRLPEIAMATRRSARPKQT